MDDPEIVDAELEESLSVGQAELVPVADERPETVFVYALRHAVPFPGLLMPVLVEEGSGQEILEQAKGQGGLVALVHQRIPDEEALTAGAFHKVGVLARIERVLRLPDGNWTAFCQGLARVRIAKFVRNNPFPIAKVSYPAETYEPTDETEASVRQLRALMKAMVAMSEEHGDDLALAAVNIETPGRMADLAGSSFVQKASDKQRILEAFSVGDRLTAALRAAVREHDFMAMGQRIADEIREQVEKRQKEFFLREQMKIIRRELGEEKAPGEADRERLEQLIGEAGMPEAVEAKAREELERLAVVPPESAEYPVHRNYLDWLVGLPWSNLSEDRLDIDRASRILDRDHYGLEEVKERVLEFLGVRRLKPDHRGSILCFVGPPGVGKTSLGRSIAESMGREFARFSLGGMRDEAEIKGHRRTYVAAMPGRVIQLVKQAGTANPVVMLDEIDKLGSDFRGDPSSALLEVLDPEQNHAFLDHYLDVPFDLSRVLFIATANVLTDIPRPLRDRMEVIELPGYVVEEKIQIGRRHLLPRQLEGHGLTSKLLAIKPAAWKALVTGWTREAGVRNLDQRLAKICRRRALAVARSGRRAKTLDAGDLEGVLGPAPFREDALAARPPVGVATGLAWTGVGGAVLSIEAVSWPGKGALTLTGKLGRVMEESASIAVSHLRAEKERFGLAPGVFAENDLHIHFPAGAVPKDGPSAGITIATALWSLLTDRRIPARLAMTGELTLHGEVLPVGGIREKVLGAKLRGVKRILLPVGNRSDVEELPPRLVRGLRFDYVETFAQVHAIISRGGRR